MKQEIRPPTATREFAVQGLDCADCAHLLEKAVGKMPGILEVRADLFNSNLRVEYAPEQVQPGKIIQAIVQAGYSVPPEAALSSIAFKVEGLDCGEEEKLIRQVLQNLKGIEGLEFFLVSGTLQVHYNHGLITPEAIIQTIARAGFHAQVKRRVETTLSWQSHWPLLRTGVCGMLTALGFTLAWLGFGQLVVDPVYAAAIIVAGYPMARKALAAARNLMADMNLLMTIAVIGAACIDEWIEAAVVVFLFSLANILENYSLERARGAIRSLLELSPLEATVQRHGGEVIVPVEDVLLGETLIIRPGSKIPLDGEIIEGGSGVNQAPITGESMPVVKGPGDPVFAGSINGRGSLLVRVNHLAQDSTLTRIIHLVEEAQAQKAPSQSFADRFARYYTPLVIIAAGLVMTVPPVILGQSFADWFYRGLVLLVISCPCALVISTPVTIVSGLARAAKNGILIKGGAYLENLATIRVIAFDKTGTLTLGRPTVTKVLPLKNRSATDVLRLAAAVESRSEHHLAQAILTQARQEAIVTPDYPESCEALPGQGVKASLNGATYYVGSHQMFADLGLCDPELCKQAESWENESQTVVVVGSSQEAMGLIVIADRLRPEAVEAVVQLRQAGISKIVMLTGDNPHVARVVAEKLGLDDYFAGLMPGDKVEAIKRLGREAPVAMVGDGVNDAPALAAATLGIAMGAAGSDAAIEAADIALMSDDLSKLPSAIRLSHQGRRIIKANIVVSLATKGVFLLLGIMGLATLWMAVFADMGTSIFVILNGLRLYRQSS